MSRVPLALQAVFLASNRGQEVHKPPPTAVLKTRKWFWQRRTPTAETPRPQKPKRVSRREARRQAAAAAKQEQEQAKNPVEEKTSQSTSVSPIVDIYVPVSVNSEVHKARRHYERPKFDRVDSSTSSVTFHTKAPKSPPPKPKVRGIVQLLVFHSRKEWKYGAFLTQVCWYHLPIR
jgi:hypothetical protein